MKGLLNHMAVHVQAHCRELVTFKEEIRDLDRVAHILFFDLETEMDKFADGINIIRAELDSCLELCTSRWMKPGFSWAEGIHPRPSS